MPDRLFKKLEKAFSDAIAVLRRILDDFKSKNPQLELKFKIRGGDG